MVEIITIIGYVAIVWVFINYLRTVLEFFKIDEDRYNKFICLKCYTFIFTLLFTMNPFTAAVASLLAYILDKLIIEKETEL